MHNSVLQPSISYHSSFSLCSKLQKEMERRRSNGASLLVFTLLAGLLSQNLVIIPVMSSATQDQKNSPDPHAASPSTGLSNSLCSHRSPPSHHGGGHGSHHGGGCGGSYTPPPPPPSGGGCGSPSTPSTPSTPSNPPSGGGYYNSPPPTDGGSPPYSGGGSPPPVDGGSPPSTPSNPPSGGGYYNSPPPTDGGSPPYSGGGSSPPVDGGSPPSTPSNPPSGGGYYNSPPPTDGGSPPYSGGGSPPPADGGSPPYSGGDSPPYSGGSPPYEPGTPTIPSPPFLPSPSPFTGTCNYWKNNPGIIWGLLGWWGTLGSAFGVTSAPGFGGASLTLPQALSNTRNDGLGALYREGTASFLNSLVNNKFPYTTNQVRDRFVASLGSNKAAAAQANLFRMANEGRMKPRA